MGTKARTHAKTDIIFKLCLQSVYITFLTHFPYSPVTLVGFAMKHNSFQPISPHGLIICVCVSRWCTSQPRSPTSFWPSCSSVASPWMGPSTALSTTWLHSGRRSLMQRYSLTWAGRWKEKPEIEMCLFFPFTASDYMWVCFCRCGETQRRRSSTPWAAPGGGSLPWLPITSSTTTVSG